MLHASSWLAYSWDFEDFADSATEPRAYSEPLKTSNGKQEHARRVSRREKFRLDAGPSREELHWTQILSVLRKVSVPSFLTSTVQINQHRQLENNASEDEDTDKGEGCPSSARSSADMLSSTLGRRRPSLQMLPSTENCNSDIKNGVHPRFFHCLEVSPPFPESAELSGSESTELKLKEQLRDVSWPFTAVGDMGSMDTYEIAWGNVPESADPMRGSGYKARTSSWKCGGIQKFDAEGEDHDCGDGDCRMRRGERKRLQVENIASALNSFKLNAGSRIVDFGCGSGALTLPLAALFPEMLFFGVDFKRQSITLLEERAKRSNLRNVVAFHGRIEKFSEPFDACVALHACGIATDLALLQALKHRAAYVMSPCCVGKLQIPIQKVMLNSARHMQPQKNRCSVLTSAGTEHTLSILDSPRENFTNHSISVSSNEIDEGLEETRQSTEEPLLRDSREVIDLKLAYPRSRWLSSTVSENDFQILARAADWSSYDHESSSSRLHSLCKVVLELDRNEASRELGYRTGLFSLSNEKAGTVGVSHILVGKPELCGS